MRISDEMVLNNRIMHQDPDYGSLGGRWSFTVRDIMQRGQCVSCLDYGCGKGGLKKALPGLDVREYDPCVAGKDTMPLPADFVLCADVLEHVEPECLDDVLVHIAMLTRKYAMLVPDTDPAEKNYPDGRNAHLIVKPAEWWRERFLPYFEPMQEDKRGGKYSFFGRPKKQEFE